MIEGFRPLSSLSAFTKFHGGWDRLELAQSELPEVEHMYVFLSNGNIDSAVAEKLYLTYNGEGGCPELRRI